MNSRNTSRHVLALLAVFLGVLGCPGALGPFTGDTISDVPCLTPSEWPENTRHFAFRSAPNGECNLLFTVQTSEQFREDQGFNFVPHEAVYCLDAASGDFALVEDSAWDEAMGPVCSGCADLLDEGPLVIDEGRLLFNGREIPVAGRRAINIFDARISTCVEFEAPVVEAVAVLSIDGNVTIFGASSGQHYHQLFSKVDGSEIGSVQRLAMGGTNEGTVRACWTEEQKYLVYRNGTQAIGIAGRICIVPVPDSLSLERGE